jgi:hypothetical protein
MKGAKIGEERSILQCGIGSEKQKFGIRRHRTIISFRAIIKNTYNGK